MEPFSWSSRMPNSDFERLADGFSLSVGFQDKTRNGSALSSTLVLDSERGELVEATVRLERKGNAGERTVAALRNHSEAERKRRARINAHLDTLRGLLPGARKMDKASLLGEVISHLKELRKSATEASEGFLMPTDVDEIRVEQQEDGLDGAPCSIRASLCCDCKPGLLADLRQALDALHVVMIRAEIATFEGRMKNVFVVTSCKEGRGECTEVCQFLASSVRQALTTVVDKFSASQQLLLKSTLANKRRRVSLFNSSLSSSTGDLR